MLRKYLACSGTSEAKGRNPTPVELHQRSNQRHGRAPFRRRQVLYMLDEVIVRQVSEVVGRRYDRLDAITLRQPCDRAGQ
jgi:hypothetical protein